MVQVKFFEHTEQTNLVIEVYAHKMVCWKETLMCVWSHSSPFIAHIHPLNRKGTSLIVEQSFDM